MKEIRVFTPQEIQESERLQQMLLILDERFIHCRTIRELQNIITTTGIDTVLVIPAYQYKKGLRGWAKVQLLASIVTQLRGVMPLEYETVIKEMSNNWAVVRTKGQVTWEETKTLSLPETEVSKLPIAITIDEFDRNMMDRAKEVIGLSNCWLDPAGCVFVSQGQILIESTSLSFNHSKCRDIPIDFRDLLLKPGERMMFCDSLHAERVGMAQAAKKGVSLAGSTIYVNKFPCRPCAMDIIGAGIRTVIFESDSYGLADAASLLVENGVGLKRVKY